MNEQTVSYTVAARFVPRIQILLDKVSKRCRRLHIAAPVLAITGSETRRIEVKVDCQPHEEGAINGGMSSWYRKVTKECIFNHVTLTGPAQPKLDGWEFAGTIEHDLETGLNILRDSPAFSKDVPLHYRNTKPVCDHCQTMRVRKDTYLVYSQVSDTFKQVWHNCIKDFLGLQNVGQALSIVEMWQDIEAILDGDYEATDAGWREWGNSPKDEKVCDLWMFLNRVAAVTRVYGFVSRKAVQAQMEAEDSMSDEQASRQVRLEATRDKVMDILFPTPSQRSCSKWREMEAATEPTDADKAKAQDAVAWIRTESESTKDYLYNMYAATANEIMPLRRAGLVASLIGSYNRHIDFEDERQRKAKAQAESLAGKIATCKHVGNVGDRLKGLSLTVVRVIPREGQYGVTYITALEDQDGNQFTWFASGTSLDVGVTYSVTGTVKSHGDFRGVPQTVLTRCKAEQVEATGPQPQALVVPRKQKASKPSQDAPRIVLTPEPVSPHQQYVQTALQAAAIVLQSGNLAGGYLEYNPILWGKIYAK